MRELRFELVEDGFTEPRGDIANYASDCSSDGILGFLRSEDALDE